ncbi:DUF4468 domain-containing protein [Spirosoma sp. RP8]|uniref:DUF4468 domain-containing protein n=1 Tax=Spirosoma liriopis TaxID=2937440 RepID=A0ABT0HN22_9BACT|nr:DUF4468 domain-containing protein [Spirosoma liriopis]MCK8493563.1 DUF4468 domain-containing protein [Spirosoma liriopis]
MKYLSLALIVVFLSSCGGFVPNEIQSGKLLGVMPMQYGKASYQITQRIPADRETIFRQARRWAAFHSVNPTQALGVSDNLLGDIITTGSFEPQFYNDKKTPAILPGVTYAASIECYDRYYRITLTNFRYDIAGGKSYGVELRPKSLKKQRAAHQLEIIDEKIMRLIDSVESFVDGETKKSQPTISDK